MSKKHSFQGPILLLLFLSAAIYLNSCTPSKPEEESTNQEQQIYIFDASDSLAGNISLADSSLNNKAPQAPSVSRFVVQVGAFKTRKNADDFAKVFTKKTGKKVNVGFSSRVNLFVVQLDPVKTRSEADMLAGELRKKYSDVFILRGEE